MGGVNGAETPQYVCSLEVTTELQPGNSSHMFSVALSATQTVAKSRLAVESSWGGGGGEVGGGGFLFFMRIF